MVDVGGDAEVASDASSTCSSVVTDAAGRVLFADSPPDVAKNGNRLGQDLIEWEYFSSFEAFGPDVGPIFGQASGIVVGVVSG